MIGFAVILALAGIIVLITAAAQAAVNRYYSTDVETVRGTVVHKRIRKRKNGTTYDLTVSYTVDGTAYERVVGALMTEYQSILEGDSIELLYKKANPKKSVRPIAIHPQTVRVVLILGASLLAVGAVLFVIGRL